MQHGEAADAVPEAVLPLKKRARASEVRAQDAAQASASAAATPPPPPEKLFCVCRQTYEDDRVMIECDRCDDWFHTDCMHIADDSLELIDVFICPFCEPKTERRTTWKAPCHRDGCRRPARLPVSRYCSDACGMRAVMDRATEAGYGSSRAARARLHTPAVEAADNRRGRAVWAYPGAEADVEGVGCDAVWIDAVRARVRAAGEGARTTVVGRRALAKDQLAHLRAEFEALARTQAGLHARIDTSAARGKLLQLAEDRQTTLPTHGDAAAGRSDPALGARCGYDERLGWSDERFQRWAETPEARAILQESAPLDGVLTDTPGAARGGEPAVCGEAKRRCKRHADWSMVRGADLEVAREVQTAALAALAERSERMRTRITELESALGA